MFKSIITYTPKSSVTEFLRSFEHSVRTVQIGDYVRATDAHRWGIPPYEWCHEHWCRHDR